MSDKTNLIKGTLTTIILKLLDDNDKMYGYEMTKKVRELTNDKIKLTEGALYPALHKLEAEGLIHSTIQQIGNRPRKYYHLTKIGKKESQKKLADILNFIEDMNIIFNLKHSI